MPKYKINHELTKARISTSKSFTATEKRYLIDLVNADRDAPPSIDPRDERFGMIVCSAVRYALGRMSYIVGTTADFVTENVQNLSTNTLCNINLDYLHERRANNLGMDIDASAWEAMNSIIVAEINRRKAQK